MWSDLWNDRTEPQDYLGALFENAGTAVAVQLDGMARTLLDPGGVDYARRFNLDPTRTGLGPVLVERGALRHLAELRNLDATVFWWTVALTVSLGTILLAYLAIPLLSVLRKTGFDRGTLLVWGVVVYFLVLGGGPFGQARFRCPVMPLLSMLVAPGLAATRRPDSERLVLRDD